MRSYPYMRTMYILKKMRSYPYMRTTYILEKMGTYVLILTIFRIPTKQTTHSTPPQAHIHKSQSPIHILMDYVKRTFDSNYDDNDDTCRIDEIVIDGLKTIWVDIASILEFTDNDMCFFKVSNSDFPWKGVQNSEYTVTLGDNSRCF